MGDTVLDQSFHVVGGCSFGLVTLFVLQFVMDRGCFFCGIDLFCTFVFKCTAESLGAASTRTQLSSSLAFC